MHELSHPIHIIGKALRTSNDNGRAFTEIPIHWEQFMKNNTKEKIPNRMDDDIYAVYTHFENAGKNNRGLYTLIIGCRVTNHNKPPNGFDSVIIPAGKYRVFTVEPGRFDKVGDAWKNIWAIPENEKKNWSFNCEFERYQSSGEIDIFIGLKEEALEK